MSQHLYAPIFLFLAVLTIPTAASAYFWFMKKLRSGGLIWTLYGIRALCGSVALMAWDVPIEVTDSVSVLAFAGPIGLVGLSGVIPCELTQRALAKSS